MVEPNHSASQQTAIKDFSGHSSGCQVNRHQLCYQHTKRPSTLSVKFKPPQMYPQYKGNPVKRMRTFLTNLIRHMLPWYWYLGCSNTFIFIVVAYIFYLVSFANHHDFSQWFHDFIILLFHDFIILSWDSRKRFIQYVLIFNRLAWVWYIVGPVSLKTTIYQSRFLAVVCQVNWNQLCCLLV